MLSVWALVLTPLLQAQNLPARDPISDRVGSLYGEFRVDESGQANYRIPLYVVPGRAGVAPDLALTYNSGAGQGHVGKGWSISGLSVISRCRATREAGDFRDANGQPVDGEARATRLDAADRFCLDGQRLMLLSGAAYGADGSVYTLELDPYTRVTLQDPDALHGPDSFTVRRRDGSVSSYGSTADSYINANNGAGVARPEAMLWALARMQDSAGNYIDYVYAEDVARQEAPIFEVRYTGKLNLPGQSGPTLPTFATVRFHYDSVPLKRSEWTAGSRGELTRRLSVIDSNNERFFRLQYASNPEGSGEDRLTAIRECWANNDLDCFPATEFSWAPTRTNLPLSGVLQYTDLGFDELESARFGDVDGDGRLDMVWAKNVNEAGCPSNRILASFFTRDETQQGRFKLTTPPQAGVCSGHNSPTVDRYYHLLDYDGDHRDDLLLADPPPPTGGAPTRWRLYRSLGRQGFDGGVDLLAQDGIVIPVTSGSNSIAQLADFNGDGLLDIVSPAIGGYAIRYLERKRDAQGAPLPAFRFSEPELVVYELPASCDSDPNFFCIVNIPLYHGYRPQDFNGDGRADLQLAVFRIPKPSGVPSLAPLDQEEARLGRAPPGTSQTFRYFLTVRDRLPQVTRFNVYGDADERDFRPEARVGDLNGDGLVDLLRPVLTSGVPPPPAEQWTPCINRGGASMASFVCAAQPTAEVQQLQVVDINRDGRSDLVYVDSASPVFNNRLWTVRYGEADGSLGLPSVIPGTNVPQNQGLLASDGWRYWFQDLDADGLLDHFGIRFEDNNQNIYSGTAPVGDRSRPLDVVLEIRNGQGARTTIDYLPLGNSAVYRRNSGSRNDNDPDIEGVQEWGRRSPVQDLMLPMQVVSMVESDAPLVTDRTARNRLYYRYQGGKIQGGGRGFLGFRDVYTIDANALGTPPQHIVTGTRYRQDFPFVGQPFATLQTLVDGSYAAESCRGDDRWRDSCAFVPGGPGFTLPAGAIFKQSYNAYLAQPAYAATSSAQSWFTAVAVSDEYNFDPANGTVLLGRLKTEFVYGDGFGNPTQTTETTLPCADPCPNFLTQKTTTTNYTNISGDPNKWWLGRLNESTINFARRDPDTLQVSQDTRKASFTYELGNDPSEGAKAGAVKSERNQACATTPCASGDANASLDIRTLYDTDPFGNRVRSYTCSGDLSDAGCRNLAILEFQPGFQGNGSIGPPSRRVHRTLRTEYDSNGRFVVATWQPYFDPTVPQRRYTERRSMEVLARDEFGEPTHVRDALGLDTWTRRGEFGREFATESETGARSETRYRWCIGVNGATGGNGGVSCPARADVRFRVESKSNLAPTRWTYFDLLGRELLTVSETFNIGVSGQDMSATCTDYDRYSRKVRTSEPFFLPGTAALSGPAFASDPCANPSFVASQSFDALGRLKSLTGPDNAITTVVFQGLTQVKTLPCNNSAAQQICNRTWSETRNVAGELIAATDANGFTVHHRYDVYGHTTRIIRDAGGGSIVSLSVYDKLGRVTRSEDPDRGVWTFEYNAAGERIRSVDARGVAIEEHRDALGRVWLRVAGTPTPALGDVIYANGFEPGSAPAASNTIDRFVYDYLAEAAPPLVPGLLIQHSRERPTESTTSVRFSFDALGRPVEKRSTIQGALHLEQTIYDALGRVLKQSLSFDFTSGGVPRTYLAREEHAYNARGFLARVCAAPDASAVPSGCPGGIANAPVYWQALSHNARGQLSGERRHGSLNMDSTRFYDPATGRIDTQVSGSGLLQNWNLDFDLAGNLLQRTDLRQGYSERARYDALDRLLEVRLTRPAQTELVTLALAYDRLGNVCSRNGSAYGYAGAHGCASPPGVLSGRPHAVTTAFGQSYFYDASGNQTRVNASDGSALRVVDYDADQQAERFTLGPNLLSPSTTSQFRYAADGGRVLREDVEAGALTRTRYLGATERIERLDTLTVRRMLPGGLILTDRWQGSAAGVREYRYTLSDHLGSPEVIVNEVGAVLERLSFDALGQRRNSADWLALLTSYTDQYTKRGYTGHEHIDAFGLVHMNGRIFDPRLGRFLQADPLLEDDLTQGLNRYSYVLNNPLTLTDPSGYLSGKQWLRVIASIAISVYLPGIVNGLMGLEKGALFGNLVAGSASGALTGGTEGAGWGAFSALTSFGIARAWPGGAGSGKGVFGSGLTSRELSARVVAHSMAGGITSVLQGGKFGHGFASAGFTAGLSPALANMNTVSATIASALIGGTISAATGGKFANGAVTSAMYIALRGAASPVTGDRDGDHLQDFDDLGDPPGAPARAFYSASDGRITRMGWENPSDHEQGFGFRIRVSAPDGTEYVYAHVDPESVVNTVGQIVNQGQFLGSYADPPNGTATGAHLHFEWRDADGAVLDPAGVLGIVMPNHRVTSPLDLRRLHPVLQTIRPHRGYDLVERKSK